MKKINVREFNPETVPLPSWEGKIDLNQINSLNIEIGCGVGLHPIQYCQENPNKTLIAIEKTTNKYNKFISRYNRHTLPNLFPIHADAVSWITHFVKKNSVNQYFILYPNPWPKKCHQNKRFHAMPFTAYQIQTLKEKGRIILRTNIREYADEALDYYQNYWNLKLMSTKEIQDSKPTNYLTHFEKKYLERGEICFEHIFEK